MKRIYTRPVCPACHALKAELTREGEPFESVTVVDIGEPRPPGQFILRGAFDDLYPGVRSFPFVVED